MFRLFNRKEEPVRDRLPEVDSLLEKVDVAFEDAEREAILYHAIKLVAVSQADPEAKEGA